MPSSRLGFNRNPSGVRGSAEHYRGWQMSAPLLGRNLSGQAGVVVQRVAAKS